MLNLHFKREGKSIYTFVLALIFIMAGCAEKRKVIVGKPISYNSQDVSQIRFIGQWLNEGKRGKLLKDFVREYEFENQHIQVILKFPEEIFADFADRKSNVGFVSSIILEEEPAWDIIRLNNQIKEIAEKTNDSLWAKNHLVDFSQIPAFRKNVLPKLLSDEVKADWGGIIPGPFLEGSYWALWTNKIVADKVGISVKSKGMTFDDFVSYIKAVDSYNRKSPEDYITPLYDAGDWQTSSVLVFQLYASALNNSKELFTNSVSDDKLRAWYKTLQALEQLSALNPLDPQWKSKVWEKSNCDLIHENCLFYSNGSWMYNIWEKTDTEKTNNVFPNEYPCFNETNIYPSTYYITWGVLKNSPNKEEAIDLLLAMNSGDIADMWVQYTKCPTGISGRFSGLTFGADQFENFSNYIQNHYSDQIYNFSEELNIFSNYKIGDSNYRAVLTGKMTADQAMEIVHQKVLFN